MLIFVRILISLGTKKDEGKVEVPQGELAEKVNEGPGLRKQRKMTNVCIGAPQPWDKAKSTDAQERSNFRVLLLSSTVFSSLRMAGLTKYLNLTQHAEVNIACQVDDVVTVSLSSSKSKSTDVLSLRV